MLKCKSKLLSNFELSFFCKLPYNLLFAFLAHCEVAGLQLFICFVLLMQQKTVGVYYNWFWFSDGVNRVIKHIAHILISKMQVTCVLLVLLQHFHCVLEIRLLKVNPVACNKCKVIHCFVDQLVDCSTCFLVSLFRCFCFKFLMFLKTFKFFGFQT